MAVIKKTGFSRNAVVIDIRIFSLSPNALFSILKLDISCGKHFEDIGQSHIAPVMYKLTSSCISNICLVASIVILE